MELILVLAKEYVAIVKHCMDKQLGRTVSKGTQYAIPRAAVVDLLGRNAYEQTTKKLTYWRCLHWADGDGAHNTKRVYIDGKKKRRRMVCIDLRTYETLTEILAMYANPGQH